ncbi:MAG: protein TolR [Pseudomonadota bacterium]
MAGVVSRRGRSGRRRSVAEINVVPYIDVMLVLLIIFMVTAPMLQQGIEVEVPKTASKTLPAKVEPVVLSVDEQGQLYLNVSDTPKAPLSAEVIQARIAAHHKLHPDVPVLVEAGEDLPYKKVIEAMSLVQKSGVEKVGLVTETPAPGRAGGK